MPVTDPEDGNAHCKDAGVQLIRILGIHRGGPTRKDDPDGALCPDLLLSDVARHDLREDMGFADPASDELGVLCPEIENKNAIEITRVSGCAHPIPTCWDRCRALPSVWMAGAHHHFGLLELLHVGVAGRGERDTKRAEEVAPPVILVSRSDKNLLKRAQLADFDPCPSGQGGVEGGHTPVETASGRLICSRQR